MIDNFNGIGDLLCFYVSKAFHNDLKFTLDESFIEKYKSEPVKWNTLAYVVFKRSFARYIESENRTEEWWEVLRRCVEGCMTINKRHCLSKGFYWSDTFAQKFGQRMFEKMWDFKFLPSGRGLWMMGTKFVEERGSMALMNCAFVSTNDMDIEPEKPFLFTLDALMVGAGVGFDTKGRGKLKFKQPNERQRFIVKDSREGWANGLENLLRAYFRGDNEPDFDYSQIRPKGERIKGFGGVSSGFEPLRDMYENIRKIMSSKIGRAISSVDIIDLQNYIAKCVVSGNIRRSAELALGDYDDDEFLQCKEDKVANIERRGLANNSIIAKIGMDYNKFVERIKKDSGLGLFWLENAQNYSRMIDGKDFKDLKVMGCNPCVEQSLESEEVCNLIETFPSKHESYDEFEETLLFAYFFGKSVTLLPTHLKETNEIIKRNARIGISQSGIVDAFVKHGRSVILKWSDNGYQYLRKIDEQFSQKWDVNPSIKLTSVKPSGTVSILAGVSSGIHYPHSKFYIRRVTFQNNSEVLQKLIDANYTYETSLYDKNSSVVEFPIKINHYKKSKLDVSVWEQLANAIDYQRYWSDNQVSITITYKSHEIDELPSVLEFAEDKLKGAIFLPIENTYEQSPFEAISEEKYKEMKAKIIPLPYFNVIEEGEGSQFCDNDGGFCSLSQK